MKKKLKCIMLVDDDADDNFFHQRVINKNSASTVVITKDNGMDALAYLKSDKNEDGTHPDLIFLDISMPRMNGWEFLEEYKLLDKELQGKAIIVMVTISGDPEHKLKAKGWDFVSDYITKPLTIDAINEVLDKYFIGAELAKVS